ncbi:MAG TPA: hypothetical protein VJ550_10280 [Geomonas sp.]|nr:hypothetical protein [Geomonas sp.]
MKRYLALLALATLMVTGCAVGPQPALSNAGGSGFVKEVPTGIAPAQGFSDLSVFLSVKTHKAGIYAAGDPHGTTDYKLLLSFDGRPVQLNGRMQSENIEPTGPRDAEGGDGVRYLFQANLRLLAGTHVMEIALPGDDVVVEREVTLPDGSSSLVLEPLYRSSAGQGLATYPFGNSFREGVSCLRVILNGKET